MRHSLNIVALSVAALSTACEPTPKEVGQKIQDFSDSVAKTIATLTIDAKRGACTNVIDGIYLCSNVEAERFMINVYYEEFTDIEETPRLCWFNTDYNDGAAMHYVEYYKEFFQVATGTSAVTCNNRGLNQCIYDRTTAPIDRGTWEPEAKILCDEIKNLKTALSEKSPSSPK